MFSQQFEDNLKTLTVMIHRRNGVLRSREYGIMNTNCECVYLCVLGGGGGGGHVHIPAYIIYKCPVAQT